MEDADAKYSPKQMIVHIYKKYPPKNTAVIKTIEDVNPLSNEQLQKIYQKAVGTYHPDKNKTYGEKWVVMCTEITKYLNKIRDSLCE